MRLGLLILPSNINKRTRRGARILDCDALEGLPVSSGLGGCDTQCPDTGICATQGGSQVRRGKGGKVTVGDAVDSEFGAGGWEVAAGEGDDGGDGGVGEALGEDFLADEAGGTGEDDFHAGWSICGVCWREERRIRRLSDIYLFIYVSNTATGQ